jgi:hypothetical protein
VPTHEILWPVSETEQIITELVHALRDAETLLHEYRMKLIREGWSNATAQLLPVRFHRPDGDIGFSGSLGGSRAKVGDVYWGLSVIRQDGGWLIERTLSFARKPETLHKPVAALPPTVCRDSLELARMLMPLVHELCSLRAPDS